MPLNKVNDNLEAAQDYEKKLFYGRVTNNVDPLGLGRFQVTVPGLYDEGELPWVGVKRYSPFGVGPGFGVYGSPSLGSTAVLKLQEGDAHYPICLGYLLDQSNADPRFASEKTWGFVDPSGNVLYVNMDTQEWTFTHSSGTTYTINEQGDLISHIVGERNITIDKSTTITTNGGNTTINTTSGNTNISTSGATTIQSGSSVTINTPQTNVLGALTVSGLTRLQGGIIVTGDAGGAAGFITGNFIHTDGILSSNGVILHTHVHPYDDGDTGPPIAG
jgi:hypothetical protein